MKIKFPAPLSTWQNSCAFTTPSTSPHPGVTLKMSKLELSHQASYSRAAGKRPLVPALSLAWETQFSDNGN